MVSLLKCRNEKENHLILLWHGCKEVTSLFVVMMSCMIAGRNIDRGKDEIEGVALFLDCGLFLSPSWDEIPLSIDPAVVVPRRKGMSCHQKQ